MQTGLIMAKPNPIDHYIFDFPKETQKLLEQMRATIRKAAPGVEETLGYGIPTFKINGKNLVHFAGYKNHIGFYPAPSGIIEFKEELSKFKGAKGSVQFPLDQPLPLALVTKITKFRLKENLEKESLKPQKISKNEKTCPKGHKFIKSSDCPTCPICEKARKPKDGFLSALAAPARRALENQGITTLKQLSRYSEKEILGLHGMGPASLPLLRSALKAESLSFKK